MSSWTARRFWGDVTATEKDGVWQILLDARPVRTPGKQVLTLPAQALAQAVADEWRAVEDKIDPALMPLTRAANSAHEKVMPQHAAVADMLAQYGATDLLCYRAPEPEALRQRQEAAWDPLLGWAEQVFGVRLNVGAGVMHVPQPPQAVLALGGDLHAADAFRLTALHDLVTLSGSLVLALAVVRDHLSVQDAWHLSRIDEDWQAEQWGIDPQAAKDAAAKRAAFLQAHRLLTLL